VTEEWRFGIVLMLIALALALLIALGWAMIAPRETQHSRLCRSENVRGARAF
jgi:hypothetical protein